MQRYDQQFKNRVIRKYLAGETIAWMSRETGLNENVLHQWKQKMVASDNEEPVKEKVAMRKRIIELESIDRRS